MYILTIDSGTTNSRIHLVEKSSNTIVDMIKKNVGVKNTAIDKSADRLKNELSDGIKEILERNDCREEDISYIVATGMITSNLGILEVPHVTGPCNLKDFADGSVTKRLPEFLNIPCVFVPGMKNGNPEETPEEISEAINGFDVMRGEEVETIGLMNQLNLTGKGLFILPGSHTKYVLADNQTIQSCLSTLGGEMLYALQKDTILSSSLNEGLVETVDEDALLAGFKAGSAYGLSRAFYQIRLLQLFEKMNENERANYFLGSILAADIKAFQTSYGDVKMDWIVVGGANPLRESFARILAFLEYPKVIEATDDQVLLSTIVGAKEIGNIQMNEADDGTG